VWDVTGPTPQLLLARPEFGSAVLDVAYRPGGRGELACCSREGVSWLRGYALLRRDQQGVRMPLGLAQLGAAATEEGPGAGQGGGRHDGCASVQLRGGAALLGCCVVPADGGEAVLALAPPNTTARWFLGATEGCRGASAAASSLQQWSARSQRLRLSLAQPAEPLSSNSRSSSPDLVAAAAEEPSFSHGCAELGLAAGSCGTAMEAAAQGQVLHQVPGAMQCCAFSDSYAAVAWDDGTVAVLRMPCPEDEPQAFGTTFCGAGAGAGEQAASSSSSCWRQEGSACRFDRMRDVAAVALSSARGCVAVCFSAEGQQAGAVVLHQYAGLVEQPGRGRTRQQQPTQGPSLLVPNPESVQPLCVAFDEGSSLLVSRNLLACGAAFR
jgi:hypothetical protein